MRKFLSLVLALAMSMSLVVVNTSAKEFTDDDELNYEEAVAVISEIGVVDGYADGSFKPQNGLTRGAAAKIICNLILGPTTAAELHADTRPFKDVAIDSEFAGYIAYCAQQGIISGYADGEFKAGNPLTGYAFMKMLLGALGYDTEIEKYVGENWSINVAKQAIGIGLNKGLVDEFNGVDYVTREEAALYAFNTLKATLVDYENKISANVNGAEVVISNNTAKPVDWSEGRNEDGNIKPDGFVQFAEEFFPDLVRKDDHTKLMEPANNWVYNKTDIGTYERYDLIVETYTTGVSGRDIYDLLKSGVIKDNELEVYVDGIDAKGTGTIAAANGHGAIARFDSSDLVRSNNNDLGATGTGVLTKVYLDTDNELITIVSINTYLAQATADYNETKEYAPLNVYATSATPNNYNVDVEDVKAVADVTEDTYYLVNMSWKDNADRGEVVTINDVEILEDSTVTKFSASDAGSGAGKVTKVTVGGEEYEANEKAFYDDEILNEYDENLLTDRTYNVYLDPYSNFLGIDLFEGTNNYVFITGYDLDGSHIAVRTATAAAIFMDGTMDEIKVNVKDTNDNIEDVLDDDEKADGKGYFDLWTAEGSGGDNAENNWYTYTVDENSTYTLKPAIRSTKSMEEDESLIRTDSLYVDGDVRNAAGNVINPARVYGEDETVYLTVDTGAVSRPAADDIGITEVTGLYTGVQSVEIEIDASDAHEMGGDVFTVYDSDHYIIAAVVLGDAIGSNENLAYILSRVKSEELRDGVYYWEFDAVMDGEIRTLTARSNYPNLRTQLNSHQYDVLELRFDGDYVVDVDIVEEDKIYDRDEATVGYPNNTKIDDESVYFVEGLKKDANVVSLSGNTLYITKGQRDTGLAIGRDARAVVIQVENGEEKKTEFSTVESAVNYLADAVENTGAKEYEGDIFALLNSNATAAWVVFKSETELKSGSGAGTGSGDSGDYFKADFKVYERGFAAGSITVKRPAWLDAAETTDLEYSFDIYVNGEPYAMGLTGTALNSLAVESGATTALYTWDNSGSNMFLYRPIEAGDVITIENFKFTNLNQQTYKVLYFDEDGNPLSDSAFTGTPDDAVDFTTGSGSIDFVLDDSKYTDAGTTNVDYRIVGAYEGTSGSYQVFDNQFALNTGVSSQSITLGKVVNATTLGEYMDYLRVYIDVGSLTASTDVKYDFTAINAPADLEDLGLDAAKYSTDASKTLTFAFTDSATAVAPGTPKTIQVTLSAAPANAAGYYVKLDGVGTVLVTSNTAVNFPTVTVDSNRTFTAADVTITPVDKLKVVAASWTDYALTVTFNRPVNPKTATDGFKATDDYTFTDNTAANGTAAVDTVSGVGSSTVTFTFKDAKLDATDTLRLTAEIHDATTGLSSNTLTAMTLTLKADGVVNDGTNDLPKA